MSDKPHIVDRMKTAPVVFDGAMGTLIYQRGVFINVCYDELCLTRPDLILDIHRDYIAAGADVIETNTFGANRLRLAGFGLADKVEEINRKAVQLARQAAGTNVYVAASVGPCLGEGLELSPANQDEIADALTEQLGTLAQEGPDLIVLETFHNLAELQLAARIAKQRGLCVLASFVPAQAGMPEEAVARALDADAHVDAVGLNCGVGPASMLEPLRRVLAVTTKPVVVMPNAGGPREVGGRMLYLNSPEYFTEYAKRFIELGVRGVGGCCGTTPEHIRLAARAVKTLSGVKQHVQIVQAPQAAAERPPAVVPSENKSAFARKLLSGQKVSSVELLPPRTGAGLGKLVDKSRRCRQAGVDIINIPDGPRASARVSVMVAALAIQNQAGIEPMPHYCCRDRNLIGMQADLLGGSALGLANWLLITGDPPKLGDYPDATGVFDVDAIGLMQLVRNLNHGMDAAGQPIDPPTALFAGVGANPVALEMEREVDRFFAKIDAGAEFAITQPVFDTDALMRFLDRVDKHPRTIPILAGVWPLLSFRNAEFMATEVPGVVVPPSILDRMSACKTKEDGKKMGVEIAREICQRILLRVSGLQVSAPLGDVDMALGVLEK